MVEYLLVCKTLLTLIGFETSPFHSSIGDNCPRESVTTLDVQCGATQGRLDVTSRRTCRTCGGGRHVGEVFRCPSPRFVCQISTLLVFYSLVLKHWHQIEMCIVSKHNVYNYPIEFHRTSLVIHNEVSDLWTLTFEYHLPLMSLMRHTFYLPYLSCGNHSSAG